MRIHEPALTMLPSASAVPGASISTPCRMEVPGIPTMRSIGALSAEIVSALMIYRAAAESRLRRYFRIESLILSGNYKGDFMSSTFERVLSLMVDTLGYDRTKVTESSTFEELGVNSMERLDLALQLEDEFGIELSDDDLEHLDTMPKLLALIDRKVAAPPAAVS